MMPRLLPILSVVAILTSACSLSVEADIPEVELIQHGVRMPGVDLRRPVGGVSITSEIIFTSSNSAWAKRMNSEVLTHQVIVTSENLPDLDFVETASLIMTDPETEGLNTEVVRYQRSKGAPSSSVLDVSPENPVDVTQLWSSTKTVIELTMSGAMPAEDWFVTLTLRLSGRIAYKY